jgi:hypothetical protein
MNPNIRTVTDLTTIPLSVAQVGTLTPVVGNVELLEYSGTASALDAILVQAGANKDQQKIDLWVWDGTQTAPFNITAWFGKFVKINGDASAYTGDFNLIESKLFGWEVISTGDGTGTVSGSAIGALNTITFKPVTDFFDDPEVVEGNAGDNLTVLEFYNLQASSDSGGGGSSDTIYTADGSISEERTVTIDNGEKLKFEYGDFLLEIGNDVVATLDGIGLVNTNGSLNGVVVTDTAVFIKNGDIGIEVFDNDIEVELGNSGGFIIHDQTNFSCQLPAYADDTAAGVAGLVAGDWYQTSGSGASPLNVAGIVMTKQ